MAGRVLGNAFRRSPPFDTPELTALSSPPDHVHVCQHTRVTKVNGRGYIVAIQVISFPRGRAATHQSDRSLARCQAYSSLRAAKNMPSEGGPGKLDLKEMLQDNPKVGLCRLDRRYFLVSSYEREETASRLHGLGVSDGRCTRNLNR